MTFMPRENGTTAALDPPASCCDEPKRPKIRFVCRWRVRVLRLRPAAQTARLDAQVERTNRPGSCVPPLRGMYELSSNHAARVGDLANNTQPLLHHGRHGVVVFAQTVPPMSIAGRRRRVRRAHCASTPRHHNTKYRRPRGLSSLSGHRRPFNRLPNTRQIASGGPWMSRWTRPACGDRHRFVTGVVCNSTRCRAARRIASIDIGGRPRNLPLYLRSNDAADLCCPCWRPQRAMSAD